MSRLTESEIQSLFDFTRKKYVRYRDVQIEIVDHLASGIEELRDKDPEIGFVKALYQVYEGFGIFGFAKIIEAKEKAMSKFWLKKIWKTLLSYFRPPVIIGTVGSMVLLYLLLSTGILPMMVFAIATGILFFCIVIYGMFTLNVKDDKIEKYLYSKTYYGISLGLLGFPFYCFTFVIDFFSFIEGAFPGMNIVLSSILFPICAILIYILAFKIPRILKEEMQERYQHLLSVS